MSIVYDPNIAYFLVSAISDKNTCQVCKELDGLHILNDKSQLERLRNYEKGIKTCISSRGCRCILVGVFKEEIGSDKIVAELEKAGGVLPKSYFEEKEEEKLRKVKENQKRAWPISQLYDYGRHFEKTNTAKAIETYTSIIDGFLDTGPTYLLRAFLRLSLCYEKEKKYRECLETIRRGLIENNKFMFHRFTKTEISSLLKRFDRCKKKYPRYKKQPPKVFSFSKWLDVLRGFGFDNSDWEEISTSLTKRFGRRSSLNDVAWALFNEDSAPQSGCGFFVRGCAAPTFVGAAAHPRRRTTGYSPCNRCNKAIVNSKNSKRLHELYNYMADFLEEEGKRGSEKLRNLAKRYKV